MQSVKMLNCGVEVVSLTTSEFCACMNYAMVNGKTYPLEILGLTVDEIDEQATSGYNSLIDEDAFRISSDGYPELMDASPTVSDFVISLDEMTYISTIKAIVSKSHMQFYWFHGETTWVLMWKTKTDWYICSDSSNKEPATVFMELVRAVLRHLGEASIGFNFIWWSMESNQMMSTFVRSRSDDIFVEKKPESPVLSSMIDKWPHHMSISQFAERAGSLLVVM
jgi:hypothetical protein